VRRGKSGSFSRSLRAAALIAAGCALIALLPATSAGELIAEQNLLISVDGRMVPKTLPRRGTAPVRVEVRGSIATTDGGPAPQLERFELELNRHGRLFDQGLPRCKLSRLRNATTKQALSRCRDALVGRGHGAAEILLPEQAPFPASGRVLAFNARIGGKKAVIGHVYGRVPVPVTTIVPFTISKRRSGPFGWRIVAHLPTLAADWGYVSRFRMTFGRMYTYKGKRRSYLNAGCPAPPGFPSALYPAVRATYRFETGQNVTTQLDRTCKVRP
jgi:hypothetical protein